MEESYPVTPPASDAADPLVYAPAGRIGAAIRITAIVSLSSGLRLLYRVTARKKRRCLTAGREALSSVFFLCLLLSVAVMGCTGEATDISATGQRNGISTDEIRIGSSLALGGHAGYLGTQTLQGALSFLRRINESGGIHGRMIRLVAKDDGYDPTRCLFNTQQLILEEKVFCLFSYVGTPTTVRVLPLINEARIPLLGMLSGASRLREPVNPLLINVRASYYQEIRAAVEMMVRDRGFTRVAVFYQYDEYGFDGLRGTELALKAFGLKPVDKGTYVRGTLEVEKGLAQITASRAQAVVMIGTYDACARFIRLAKERHFSPLFYNVSFVGATELARRLGNMGEDVVISQVVPPPWADVRTAVLDAEGNTVAKLPGITAYVEDLNRYYPAAAASFVGLEGHINARILVEGLRRAGRDLTRDGFLAAIESIRHMDLGIGYPVSFGKTDDQGLAQVYFTQIQGGRLVLIP